MYSFPEASDPIRQGDIFRGLPKIELVLGSQHLPIISELVEGGGREVDWLQYINSEAQKPEVFASISVRPATGIVITQDCDALRATSITFCEIKPFCEVSDYHDGSGHKSLISILTQHICKNQKWYYLAEHPRMNFSRKMGVDFRDAFVVPWDMVNQYKETLRLGRLDDEVAWPHFRERVSEFFRRYPYNDWYPLNIDELDYYEVEKLIVSLLRVFTDFGILRAKAL